MIGIYKITNKISGKIYIGQSGALERRLNAHKRSALNPNDNQYDFEMYKDIRKFGLENFEFEILEVISLDILEEEYIKQYKQNGCRMYNKILNPSNNKGFNSHNAIFNESDIKYIISLLQENKISNIKIAEEVGCSPATIDDINNGKRYKQNNLEYPIRQFAKGKGGNNTNAAFSDEEVIEIRNYYVNHTGQETYLKYGKDKFKTLKSFERVLNGKSYSHLPYYKKREKIWVGSPKQEGCID